MDHLDAARIPSFETRPQTPPPTNTSTRPAPRKKVPKPLEDVEMRDVEKDKDEELLKATPTASRRGQSAASSTSSKRDLSESPSQTDQTPKRPRTDSDADKKMRTDPTGLDLGGKIVVEGTDIANLVPEALGQVCGLRKWVAIWARRSLEMRLLYREETSLQTDMVHPLQRALRPL